MSDAQSGELRRTTALIMALLLMSAGATADPNGWRGDGTGHFPDQNPPTQWAKGADGKTAGIIWQKKMPHYSFASPLLVGDRLLIRCEPYDLVCLEARSGKLLWVRSHGPDEIVSPEQRKDPQWPEVAATTARLSALNQALYDSAEPPADLVGQKLQLQKRLGELTAHIDRQYRLAPEMWRSKWSGYTGSTPCTDGRNVYFTSNMGVIGCYDLDGNRKWMAAEPVNSNRMGEHGCGSSPAVVGDRLIYCVADDVVALNKETGEPLWRQTFNNADSFPSILAFESAGQHYVIGKRRFMRVEDGSIVEFKDDHMLSMSMIATPVIKGNHGYFLDSAGRLEWISWNTDAAGQLHIEREGLIEFALADESKRWDNAYNFWVASPVELNGLVYCLSCQGRMVIVDTVQKKIVYDKSPDLSPNMYKTGMHGGYIVGCCASPTLAGGHLYLMDNTGRTLVMEPGPDPKTITRNQIEQIVAPWDPKHFDAPHQEATLSSPLFVDGRLYYRGEQYVYCIGKN
ncbi:MAG: outer rane biosis protein [Phycisphaerales bacterium]|nr:outer rane biosis protein [Phycisphaerales bacterium]